MISGLTPDNADEALTSSLDISKIYFAVSEKAEMTECAMFTLLKSRIIDPKVVISIYQNYHVTRRLNGRSSHFHLSEGDMSNRLDLTSLMTWSYTNQKWR